MSDFKEIVFALGRGIIKLAIAGLVGVGVGMLIIGIITTGRPQVWHEPMPGPLFIGVGAGLLSGGFMLLVLFLVPWLFKRTPHRGAVDEETLVNPRPVGPADPPAERSERGEHRGADFYER